MDYLADHRIVLEKAAEGNLPDRIDENSSIPVGIVHELIEKASFEPLTLALMMAGSTWSQGSPLREGST